MSGLALRARRYAEKLIRAELATSKILAITRYAFAGLIRPTQPPAGNCDRFDSDSQDWAN